MSMFTDELRARLSESFSLVESNIVACQNLLDQSSISPQKKAEILHDLRDIEKIMKQRSLEDVDAIEEAIIALTDVKVYCDGIRDEQQLKMLVTYTLRLLNNIKNLLSDEGLVPGDIGIFEDGRSRSGSAVRSTSGYSSFFYTDDTGNSVHLNPQEEQLYPFGLNHIFRL